MRPSKDVAPVTDGVADTQYIRRTGLEMCARGRVAEAADMSGRLQEAVVAATGSHILGLMRKGLFLEEIYLMAGDSLSAENALEDTRIFLTRQGWEMTDAEQRRLLESCLDDVALRASAYIINGSGL